MQYFAQKEGEGYPGGDAATQHPNAGKLLPLRRARNRLSAEYSALKVLLLEPFPELRAEVVALQGELYGGLQEAELVARVVAFAFGSTVYGMSVTSSGSRVTNAWDTVPNQQLSFGYDDMDRLSSRTVTAGSPQSFTYSYDRWGNRVSQVAIHSGPSMSTSFSTGTNQIGNANGNTYAYDAAGNVRSDGTYTYTHDAEGNLTGVSGLTTATYVYDALNHRVETVTSAGTQQFLFDAQGKRQATLDSSGNALSEQSYLGSAPLAFFQSGSFHFQHQDWLGTERLRTSQTGTTEGTYSSLPFGDGYTATGSDQDASHFTGLDRDIETGNSHAMFRDYSSATGTWMRPDPYAGSYDLSNPQSMNRYAYVANNPLVFSDPLGLDHLLDGGCLYHDTGTFSGTGTQDDPLQPIVEIICPPSDPGIRISGPGPAPNNPAPTSQPVKTSICTPVFCPANEPVPSRGPLSNCEKIGFASYGSSLLSLPFMGLPAAVGRGLAWLGAGLGIAGAACM